MDPMTIAALIQAGIGLAGGIQKTVASAKQNKMAKEYGKTKRPEYQLPPSLQKATDMARANLNPAVNSQLLQEIGTSSANAINRASKVGSSTADMLAVIGNANAQENAAKRQFFGDNQQRKDMMLGNYMNQLSAMAGQENKAWEWNKAQPYLNSQEASQALHQSSAQNAAGALGDLAGGIAGGANSLMQGKQIENQKDIMSQMMKMFGGGETKKSGLTDAAKLGTEMSMKNAMKPTFDGMDNSLAKELGTPLTLPKLNTNANVPQSVQIAENPVAPLLTTNTTGQVLANGKLLNIGNEQTNLMEDIENIIPPNISNVAAQNDKPTTNEYLRNKAISETQSLPNYMQDAMMQLMMGELSKKKEMLSNDQVRLLRRLGIAQSK